MSSMDIHSEKENDDAMPTEQQIHEVVGALVFLEKKDPGVNPSVARIAEQAGLTNGTAYNHLKAAAERGIIIQRAGKFMTLAFARIVDERMKEETKKK